MWNQRFLLTLCDTDRQASNDEYTFEVDPVTVDPVGTHFWAHDTRQLWHFCFFRRCGCLETIPKWPYFSSFMLFQVSETYNSARQFPNSTVDDIRICPLPILFPTVPAYPGSQQSPGFTGYFTSQKVPEHQGVMVYIYYYIYMYIYIYVYIYMYMYMYMCMYIYLWIIYYIPYINPY